MKKLLLSIACSVCLLSLLIFAGCSDGNSIIVSGVKYSRCSFTQDGITTAGYKVAGCKEDIEVLIIQSEVNGLPVLGIDNYAFRNNKRLKDITIPDSIDSYPVCSKPFEGCTNIVKITAGSSNIMNLFTDYGGGDNNKEHTIPASVHYIYLSKACTKIGYRDFYYCTNLREIHIPSSVTEIKDGTGLTSIGVNGHPSVSAKFSDLPFIGCEKLSIFCEATSKPDGWGVYWNYIDETTAAQVYWNNY